MKTSTRSLATLLALALSAGTYACSSEEGGGGSGGSGGSSSGGRGGAGGSASGGSGGTSSGGTGGTTTGGTGGTSTGTGGTTTGGTGGTTTGGTGGTTTGGTGGTTPDAGSGGTGGTTPDAGSGDTGGSEAPAAGGSLKLNVHGATMNGDRNCYQPASNDRGNQSPKMDWGPAPEGTKSWALTTYDITGRSAHMVICDIPLSVVALEANIKTMVPQGAQWSVGHGNKMSVGWYGPGANGAPRHYEIEIWAIPTEKISGGCGDARAFHTRLRDGANNKALVLGSAKWDFWGNAQGACR